MRSFNAEGETLSLPLTITGDHDDLARPYIVDKNIRIKKTDIAETMSI